MQDENINLIYNGRDVAAALKPAGVSSEEDGGHGMPAILSRMTGLEIYPVHRLDKGVGGVMIFAKNKKSAAHLSSLIAAHKFEKQYLAVVSGECPEKGEMKDLLFKDRKTNKSYVVKKMRRGVREAVLEYERLAFRGGMSLVKIKLVTGRSHQIRVQFASRRHPIAGDCRYGGEGGCPIALWSWRAGFETESGEAKCFSFVPSVKEYPWCEFEKEISSLKE